MGAGGDGAGDGLIGDIAVVGQRKIMAVQRTPQLGQHRAGLDPRLTGVAVHGDQAGQP